MSLNYVHLTFGVRTSAPPLRCWTVGGALARLTSLRLENHNLRQFSNSALTLQLHWNETKHATTATGNLWCSGISVGLKKKSK